MTAFGVAVLGFVAAVIVVAVRAEGRRLAAELRRGVHWPLESDGIDFSEPSFLDPNFFRGFVEAVDVRLWEIELSKREDEDA
jgi:hypothetical protein